MHLKSFTFGMGTGIIILSLIFFIAISAYNVNNETELYSDNEIIFMAEQLGMIFPEEESTLNEDMNMIYEDLEEINELIDHNDDQVDNTDVTLFINVGTPAIDIAEMLYSENIIDSAYSFNQFLIRTGFSNRLKSGSLTFKTNSSYEEATSVLIGRNLLPHEL